MHKVLSIISVILVISVLLFALVLLASRPQIQAIKETVVIEHMIYKPATTGSDTWGRTRTHASYAVLVRCSHGLVEIKGHQAKELFNEGVREQDTIIIKHRSR